ncbi:hypothetical protein P6709_01060 [Jeotgalibacillus sp. ET6]|uniref:DUF6115 domain-containing protein n=1 Tax=Jeotgalibacillus sp. ET6 TaxID=3037260 RepID=UPI0024188580|nr:hypothetical protein [Jeotgalibacillus sp. ET6]MDG5470315.1 hypothetical protein [Jeotgalibacillus sp. ET6]
MIIFLLILSILFNLIAFLSIYLLFMRQNKLMYQEEKHKKTLNEFEETFTSYLQELKEDNAQFLSSFEQIQKSPQLKKTEKNPPFISQEPLIDDNQAIDSLPDPIRKASRSLAANQYKKKPERNEQRDAIEESFEQKVFRLSKEGLSPAQIAKKLHKGQTEIELLLKFRKKSN